jgi:hypothetical protein
MVGWSRAVLLKYLWICNVLYEVKQEPDHDTWGASYYVRKTCRVAEHIATEGSRPAAITRLQLPMIAEWLKQCPSPIGVSRPKED